METSLCTNCRSQKPISKFSIGKFGKRRKLCDDCIELVSQRYSRRRGIECMWCGEPSNGKIYCDTHRKILRDRVRESRAKRPARTCKYCGAVVGPFKQACSDCVQKNRIRITHKWHKQRVLTLYEKYGGARCACCGETTFEFLSLDHINGDGAAHRKEIGGSGSHLYAWIVRKNYPPGFAVLCYNCNAGRYRNGGICPHKSGLLPA